MHVTADGSLKNRDRASSRSFSSTVCWPVWGAAVAAGALCSTQKRQQQRQPLPSAALTAPTPPRPPAAPGLPRSCTPCMMSDVVVGHMHVMALSAGGLQGGLQERLRQWQSPKPTLAVRACRLRVMSTVVEVVCDRCKLCPVWRLRKPSILSGCCYCWDAAGVDPDPSNLSFLRCCSPPGFLHAALQSPVRCGR